VSTATAATGQACQPPSKPVHMTSAQRGSPLRQRTWSDCRILRHPRHAQAPCHRDSSGTAGADAGRVAMRTVRRSPDSPGPAVVCRETPPKDQLAFNSCQARSERAQPHHLTCCLVAFCNGRCVTEASRSINASVGSVAKGVCWCCLL
jgi:hypothetical protein